jgi:hypothetical protein
MPKVNNHPIGKKYDQSSYDDVMITILGVIANFLQKNWRFSQIPIL